MTAVVPEKEFEGMLESIFEKIDFVKNYFSSHFRISPKTVIVIIAAIALSFILLVLIIS
jgi:hypothetical protein